MMVWVYISEELVNMKINYAFENVYIIQHFSISGYSIV